MNIDELRVELGADLGDFDKGLNAAVRKVESFGADLGKAATSAGNSFNGIAAGVNAGAGRYTDATGRMREANGRFVSSATLAREAAGNLGGVVANSANGFGKFSGAAGKSAADLNTFSNAAKSAGQGLSTFVTLPLLAVGAGALASAGKLDSLRRGLEAVAETQLLDAGVPALEATARAATETTARLKQLEEIAKLPGLGFEDAVKGDLRLRNAGLSADRSAKSLQEFGNAIARAGGGKEQLDRVTLALSQIATKGKVSQEEINQLTEAGIVLGPIMKKAFGTADTEALQKAGIDATTFVDGITDELSKLPRVTGGIANAFENAGDASSKALGRLGLAAEKTFNISGLVNRFADGLAGLSARFEALSPTAQKTIFVIAGLAAAVGPVLLAIGAIGAAVPAVVAGLGFLGTAFAAVGSAAGVAWAAILSPIAPIVLAVTGLVAAGVLLYQNWDEISARAAALGNALRDKFLAVLEPLRSGLQTVGAAALALGFTTVGTTALAASDGVGALEGQVKELQFTVGNTRAEMESLRTSFQGIAKQTFDPSLNLNPDAFLSLVNASQLAVPPVARLNGLLTELEAKLKLAKQAQQNATSEKALAGYNQTIESLEKQIKRLQELGIASKEAASALTKVQESLREVDRMGAALGSTYDYIAERGKALESGIKTLIGAGFAPQSRAVQDLLTQLRALPTAYDAVTKALPKGLEEFKPFVRADVEINPLDSKATQTIQQELERLGVKVPPLDLTGFTASASELQQIAARLTQLPDAGAIDLSQPISSLAELRTALGSLTGLALPALDTGSLEGSVNYATQVLDRLPAGLSALELPALPPLPPLDATAFDQSITVVEDMTSRIPNAITGMSNAAVSALAQFNTDVYDTFGSLSEAFSAFAASVGTSMGASIGEGVNVLKAATGALLKVAADYAAKYGALLIKLGAANLVLPGMQGLGIAQIAGGIALIAAAGIAGAAGASMTKPATGTSSGAGGGGIAPRTPSTAYKSPTSTNTNKVTEAATQNNTTVVQLTLDGRQVAQSVTLYHDKQSRVVAPRR